MADDPTHPAAPGGARHMHGIDECDDSCGSQALATVTALPLAVDQRLPGAVADAVNQERERQDAVVGEYGIARREGDALLVVEGDGWIKLPLSLAKGPDGTVDAAGLELAILSGFLLRHIELLGYSPTLRKLQELSGRGRARTMAGLEMLARMGVIRMKKVPFKNADREGWKWHFSIPKGSPLEACKSDAKSQGRPWVMLPEGVARFQSTLASALAIVCEEMRRQDGAVVGTPTMFGRMLGCSRSTATRLLKQIGAVRVARSRDGSFVYHYRQHVRVAGVRGSVKVRGVWLGYAKDEERERLGELDVLIRAAGSNMGDTPARVAEAGGNVATLVRALEEEHLGAALRDPHLRVRIRKMLSFRLRKRFHRIPLTFTRETRRAQRAVFHHAAAANCATCDDVHLVEGEGGRYVPCPTCRPRAAAPPG